MLTGDKGATAKQIGLQCGMLQPEKELNDQEVTHNGNSKVFLRQINETPGSDVLKEFTELNEIIDRGDKLEIMVSGLRLIYILKHNIEAQ